MPKIMLAEDDLTMLHLLDTLLRIEGYQTVKLSEEENVLDAAHRERPEIILLDVHLRDINGLDILKEIRSDATLRKTIVIMQSGMNMTAECSNAGADVFLLKPYMPDMLIDAIKDCLAHPRL